MPPRSLHDAAVAENLEAIARIRVVATGTAVARPVCMAAVLALVFLFVVASIGFMLKSLHGGLTFGSVAMVMTFGSLSVGLFLGLFKLARGWEEEVPTGE